MRLLVGVGARSGVGGGYGKTGRMLGGKEKSEGKRERGQVSTPPERMF